MLFYRGLLYVFMFTVIVVDVVLLVVWAVPG